MPGHLTPRGARPARGTHAEPGTGAAPRSPRTCALNDAFLKMAGILPNAWPRLATPRPPLWAPELRTLDNRQLSPALPAPATPSQRPLCCTVCSGLFAMISFTRLYGEFFLNQDYFRGKDSKDQKT